MFFPEMVSGVILIICGFLVKAFPNLIAGYNSLTESQKKRVDIQGLSTFMRNHLIILGILVILIGLIFKLMGYGQHVALLVSSSLIVIYVILIAILANKYYRN